MRRRSLAISFMAVVLAVLLVGQGLLWLWFLKSQRSYHMELLRGKVQTVAKLLEGFSATAILSYNYSYLDQYMDALAQDMDILAVKVMDDEGHVLRDRVLREQETGASWNPFYVAWKHTYTAPIMAAGQQVGTLQVLYSGRKVNESMRYLLTVPPLGQVVVFLLVIFAIFRVFRYKVGRPIQELNARIRDITNGDLTVEIPTDRADEIGSIAQGLSFLKETLRRNIQRLEATADNVGMAIRQLNITFNKVSEGMKRQEAAVGQMASSVQGALEAYSRIASSTDALAEFSTENVTSLLEVKATAEEIASGTNRLMEAVEGSYSAVSELAQTAKQVMHNTQEVLSSVEQTSASVQELNASVKEVERGARESAKLADQVRTMAAEEGVLAISDAIDSMEKITDKVKESVQVVSRLGARSKDIEKMLSVIKEVTEQTTLLSLNAAILAAQAGEYGKSFSVVADEMGALSERTASSTKEIAAIVKTIQEEIAQVVSSIEEAMLMVEDGGEHVLRAGKSSAKVVEAAQQSSRMAHTIQRATEEQVKGLGQIQQAMEHVKKMVFQISHSTEEQFQGTDFLLERTGELKEVAEATKRGTQEQASGTRHISQNMELANQRLEEIRRELLEYQIKNEELFVPEYEELNQLLIKAQDCLL